MATRSTSNSLCCRSFPRGTLLLLAWNALLNATQWFRYLSLYLAIESDLQVFIFVAYHALCLLLPLIGWVAELWMGRYRAVIASIFLSVIAFLASMAVFVMMQLSWTLPPTVILCTALPIATAAIGIFYTYLLPFTLDQMMEVSADLEELSTSIHWCYWGYGLGVLMLSLLQCIPIWSIMFQDILPLILLTLSTLCLSAVLISDCIVYSWPDSSSKITNSVKLIYKVLNYARKTKYPPNCSTSTYLNEKQPSRLDFGKEKFGGPFTEEQIEDVKTVFCNLPLLIATGAFLSLKANDAFLLLIISTSIQALNCVAGSQKLIKYITILLLIPAYHFILYPVFYNYIPSMMKRAGAGLFLCLVSTLINLTLDTVGHPYRNTTYCMLDTNTGSSDTLSISLSWLLISDTVYGIGIFVVTCSSLEFIMARTPNRMRGVMLGLAFTTVGICVVARQLLEISFQQFNSATPSCGFYYYLVLSLLILLILALFSIFSKHCKLQERDKHVNIKP